MLFVPYMPGSELANRLRKEESRVSSITGYRVKIVERTGTQLIIAHNFFPLGLKVSL